jgi:glycosyltransferase involved in cell wall biosynthesis
MLELSVIICSHNPRAPYLRRVLEALRGQTLPRDRWQLLVIDNASREPLVSAFDISWHPNGRHILEQELGLAPARRRGMLEAAADLFVFVDDDNVLASDYLSEVTRIKREWPILGAWGSGAIIPEFEHQPPPRSRKYLPYLALREITSPRWSNFLSFSESPPIGAGLCVRAEVAAAYRRHYEQPGIEITGRKGTAFGGAEDYEICFIACELGLGIGQFPSLKITHLIPKERLSDDYLVRIVEGSQMSILLVLYKWRGEIPRLPCSPRSILSSLKYLLTKPWIDRRMSFARRRAIVGARRIIAQSERTSMSASIGRTKS